MRQAIGILMGIDPAPFWTNLYLYSYEEEFVFNLVLNGVPEGKSSSLSCEQEVYR